MAQNIGPVLFDVVSGAQFVHANQTPWMTAFNGKLYAFLQSGSWLSGTGAGVMGFYRSTDGGNTWVLLDAAHAPAGARGCVSFDLKNNRAIVAYVSEPVVSALKLTQFNLQTELWGASIATGGPNSAQPNSVFLRPDGSIAVIYDFGTTPPLGTTRLRAAVWTTVWSGSIDLGVNAPTISNTVQPFVTGASALMDPVTGVIHVKFNTRNGASPYYVYQQFLANNTLGNFHRFTDASFLATLGLDGSNMILLNGQLMFLLWNGASAMSATLLTGAPLSNPVWTETNPAIFANPPTASANFSAGNTPYATLATDGTVAVAQVTFQDTNGFPFVQLAISKDAGATWNVNIGSKYDYYMGAYDSNSAGAASPDSVPTQSTVDPNVSIVSTLSGGVQRKLFLQPSLQLVVVNGATLVYSASDVSLTAGAGGGLNSTVGGYLMNAEVAVPQSQGVVVAASAPWPPPPLMTPLVYNNPDNPRDLNNGKVTVQWAAWFNAVYGIEKQGD